MMYYNTIAVKPLFVTTTHVRSLESTLVTSMQLENTDGSGDIAVPAKILTHTLKEFSDIPLTFEIDTNSMMIVIQSMGIFIAKPGTRNEKL